MNLIGVSLRKKRMFFIATLLFLVAYASPVLAADEPKLVSGTLQLLNDATKWLLILVPVSTAFKAGWHYWLKQLKEGDPAEAAQEAKAAKNAIIAGIIITSIVGLVKVLLSYYS